MTNEGRREDAPGQNKTYTLIVNARQRQWSEKHITFEQVTTLAFENPPFSENTLFSITFAKGEDKREGILVAGDSVPVKDGMIFNVTATDKS